MAYAARSGRIAPPRPARRLGFLTIAVCVAFALLGGRVVQLQAMSGDHYKDLALQQRLRTVPVEAQRGSIFDRNGRDLAASIELSTVYGDPKFVVDPAAYAARLAPVLGVDAATITSRLADRTRRFVVLAHAVDDTVADAVRALGLAGIGFVPESKRVYPAGALAASVLGMVGGEGKGLGGLEYLYEDLLHGSAGEIVVERDQRGREIPDTVRRKKAAERGVDLVLSLDQALQYEVERSLVDQVTATNAKGGMAAVLDLRNGDVLAMATVEGAAGGEPARPADPRRGERNRVLTDVFEPGSTNKLITMSRALEDGLVAPSEVFEVPTQIRVGDEWFEDVESHPLERWRINDILRESSNVGTIQIAQRMSNGQLADALRDFGLGRRTSIRFPGQAAGLLLDPSEYYATGLAATAIGYGLAVTPMQMLDVYATVANDGVTQPPRLLRGTIDAEGTRHAEPVARGRRVLSGNTSRILRGMLAEVVAGGTGACASIPGYTVGGKTGTSRKAQGGGYVNRYMASFIGFAPASAPRFAAIVVLDEPVPIYGGRAAAPVFSEMMRFTLEHYDVAPDDAARPSQFEQAQAKARAEGEDCAVPHGAALDALVAARSTAVAPVSGDGEAVRDGGARYPAGATTTSE